MLFTEFVQLAKENNKKKILLFLNKEIPLKYGEINFEDPIVHEDEDEIGYHFVINARWHNRFSNSNKDGSTQLLQKRIQFETIKQKNEKLFKANLSDELFDISEFSKKCISFENNLILINEHKDNFISRKEIRKFRLDLIKRERLKNGTQREYSLRWFDDQILLNSDVRSFLGSENDSFLDNLNFDFNFFRNDDQIHSIVCKSKLLNIKTTLDIGIELTPSDNFLSDIENANKKEFLLRCNKIYKLEKYYIKLNNILDGKLDKKDFAARINKKLNVMIKLHFDENDLDKFIA